MTLSDKVKLALEETRILILGAQILLGFGFRGVFAERFDRLPPNARYLDALGLALLVCVVALLIAPGHYHGIAERGQDSGELHRYVTEITDIVLLLFALALGVGVYVGAEGIFDEQGIAIAAGTVGTDLPRCEATQQTASILLKPKHGQYIASNRLRRQAFEAGCIRQDVEPNTSNTGNPVISDQHRRVHPDEPVDEAGAQQRGGEPSSALYEKPRDAPVAECREGRTEVNMAIGGRIDIDHCDPAVAELLSLLRDRGGRSNDPGHYLSRIGNEPHARRDAQPLIDDNTHRGTVTQPGKTARQLRIIGEHRSASDHNRVVNCA